MTTKKFFLAACLAAGVVFSSCDKNDDENLNDTDRDFLMKTGMSNSAEVDAATLASSKATNAAVKAFAQSMISEHSSAQSDLKVVGSNVGYAVKDSIDATHVAMKAMLSALSGRAFDSVYINAQASDHLTVIGNFQNELTNGSHSEVKTFASNNLPHIQMHQQRADSIATAYFKKK